jgi:hypothetical protein
VEAVIIANDRARASSLVGRTEAVAGSIAYPPAQGWALADAARAAAAIGDHDRAETIARAIADPEGRSWALGAVARSFAVNHDFDRAVTIARCITDPQSQASTLAQLAQEAAAAGQLERARQLATWAEAAVSTVSDRPEQWAVGEVAVAYSAIGDVDGAERLINAIGDADRRDAASAQLVEAMAPAGHFDRADKLTRTINEPDALARATIAMTRAAAVHGDLDLAEQIAGFLRNARRRGRALAQAAEATAATDSNRVDLVPRIRSVVAHALHLAPWETALNALVHIDHGALAALVDEQEGLLRTMLRETGQGRLTPG